MTTCKIALCALLLLACGKDSGTAPSGAEGDKGNPGAAESSGKAAAFDACALLTQADATELFGVPAKKYTSGAQTPDAQLQACGWDHDFPDNSSHLLQLVTYDTDIAYSADPDSKPFEIGDKGNVKVHKMSGVDVTWVQKGKTLSVAYSTTGPSAVPEDITKAEQVKALAKKIESRL